MKRIIRKLLVLLLLLCTTLGATHAQTLIFDHFVYLPVVVGPSAPTPTPTPTPTPLPTPILTGTVHILPNHSHYVTEYDTLHVVGEVRNDSPYPARFVRLTVNLFSDTGQFLSTEYTYTSMDVLLPGVTTCFNIGVWDAPSGWAYYELEHPAHWTTTDPQLNLTFFNHHGSYDPTYEWYTLLGFVRNDGGCLVEYVSPIGTLYNAAGMVVDCGYTFTNDYDLDPGQASSFEMNLYGRDNYADVTSYRLQVDGWIDD